MSELWSSKFLPIVLHQLAHNKAIIWKLTLIFISCLCLVRNGRICAANIPKFSAVEGVSHDRQIQRVVQAFEDVVLLARVATATFGPCEEIFLRYFSAPGSDIRQTGLPDNCKHAPQPGAGRPESKIRSVGNCIREPSRPSRKQASVPKGEGGTTAAFAFIDPRVLGDIALVSMCDEAFEYPSPEETANPPSSVKAPESNPEPGYTCDGLGDDDSDWMTSPGGILLHELLHWTFLLDDITGFSDIIDENDDEFPQIVDLWGPDPPDGYGPFHVMQLRTQGAYIAIQNADTYRCYAQSKYWTWKCGKSFGRAQSDEDNTRGAGIRIIQDDPETEE
ncbi:hypothetical protein Z517_10953 [Fonsecaea pedrosoi CBS 271.37]|uniref:Lysine-specific metallo-endopeptidase domain-containing protein n=1 Tax=Fonsecaea pedrosoi CBS 271.37 TaxID=1442368 RepID=A0A0D2EP98_9EURO|nr:uncharacterized protein Z517_10953 [Fonsecaea pedrosoi CBS 271.37]KIW76207.1 hypothetical protein Z517_10953 [Fonsecaea pedrosoi CBS 271.37]